MKNYLRKVLTSICVLLLPVMSYLILGPLEVYFGNTKNFEFTHADFFYYFLAFAAVALVVGSLLLALLPKKVHGIALAVILGIGVASYIQSLFMNIKLSEVDGSPLDWSTLGNFPIINLLIWIGILAAVLVVYLKLKDRGTRMLRIVPTVLNVIQLIAVVSLFMTAPGINTDDVEIHGDQQFMLGKEDNVVVFVLDTFGNTRLEELMAEDPKALEGFEDFTYYNNADCHYYTTFPSVTHFLTGVDFDFDANSPEWLRSAWNSDRAEKFYETLHENGYTCNFYSKPSYEIIGETKNLYAKYDNIQPANVDVYNRRLLTLLGELSLYRYFPYVLKADFEVLTHEFDDVVTLLDVADPIHDNPGFYSEMMAQGLSVDDTMKKSFVVQHLFGIHAPCTTGSHGEYVEEASSVETMQGLVFIIREYMDQMKALGVYDDATIIVMADHGSWSGNDPQPIFMIKKPNETHKDMPVNTAPVSLDDFQATILEVVGSKDDSFGTSIFDWQEGDTRERTVYMRKNIDSMPKVPGSYFNAYHGFSYTTDKYEMIEKMYGTPEIVKSATPWNELPPEPDASEEDKEASVSIVDIVALPLAALMKLCYSLLGDYGLTILAFTLLSKIILLPVSLWVHQNGITMVKITPEVNRIKIKHFGDRDAIDDETQALYKREKYNPLASTVPMIVQIVMLLGVIGAVKSLLADADSALTLVPSEAGGLTWLMPLAAGGAALVLGLAQNKLSPLQREQGKKEQWMSNGFSIAISLFLGAFVSLGVGIYWIASNLLTIVQQLLLNVMIRPEKHIDYAALEESKKELASLDSLDAQVSKEDKKRERDDYKKFFSVANKHLVIYSEKSGFYKYYKDVMDFMLRYSNVIIHYVTNDPKDQIFAIAEDQPRIRPYYISEKKLITLLMKMDADMVVMTCPDLDRFHLKRSYVRKDIEYVYMFHYPLSTHMVLNNGALDHYDTILCVGDFQFEEIRAAERLYGLPEKKLISAGYGQLEQLHSSYQKMEKTKRAQPKILIAPSWQQDNILDSCIDLLLDQLLDKGYEVVVRPHPEYVKRYKPRMDAIVQRYEGRNGLVFELDFTSNDSLFNSDVIISDWSGSAYEFSLVTLKPAVFVNTPPKINNPEYHKLNVEPLEFKLRGEVGIQIDPENMEGLARKIDQLLENSEAYAHQIQQIRDKYIANFGRSGEVGGKYILEQLLKRQEQK